MQPKDTCMHWYVLTTAPQRELDARDELIRKGVEAWAPQEWVEQRQRRHDHHAAPMWKARPFLSRYVLARLPSPDDVTNIFYEMSRSFRPTVTGYLGCYGRPIPVPDRALDALRDVDGAHRSLHAQRLALKRGQIVNVHGRPATVSRTRGNRATALMEWLGAQREVEIDVRQYQQTG